MLVFFTFNGIDFEVNEYYAAGYPPDLDAIRFIVRVKETLPNFPRDLEISSGSVQAEYKEHFKLMLIYHSGDAKCVWTDTWKVLLALEQHYQMRPQGKRDMISAKANLGDGKRVSFSICRIEARSLTDFKVGPIGLSGMYYPFDVLPAIDADAVHMQAVEWAREFNPNLLLPNNFDMTFGSDIIALHISLKDYRSVVEWPTYGSLVNFLNRLPYFLPGKTGRTWPAFDGGWSFPMRNGQGWRWVGRIQISQGLADREVSLSATNRTWSVSPCVVANGSGISVQ